MASQNFFVHVKHVRRKTLPCYQAKVQQTKHWYLCDERGGNMKAILWERWHHRGCFWDPPGEFARRFECKIYAFFGAQCLEKQVRHGHIGQLVWVLVEPFDRFFLVFHLKRGCFRNCQGSDFPGALSPLWALVLQLLNSLMKWLSYQELTLV